MSFADEVLDYYKSRQGLEGKYHHVITNILLAEIAKSLEGQQDSQSVTDVELAGFMYRVQVGQVTDWTEFARKLLSEYRIEKR